MQSLMEINTTGSSAGGIFKRKKPNLRSVDRSTEISNSPRNNNISGSGYEISSCSTLHKLNDDDVDIGDQRDVDSKLVEACFRETSTPSPEICSDTDEMELSTVMKKSDPRMKSPTADEIEEFFSAAEKEDQKKFMNKYNFDVVKDVPLAGRYEWVRIKPQ